MLFKQCEYHVGCVSATELSYLGCCSFKLTVGRENHESSQQLVRMSEDSGARQSRLDEEPPSQG